MAAMARAGCEVRLVRRADPDLAGGHPERCIEQPCVRFWEAALFTELASWGPPPELSARLFAFARQSDARRAALDATMALGGLDAAADLVAWPKNDPNRPFWRKSFETRQRGGFQIMGTVTGRFSSAQSNLANFPRDHDE